MKRFTETEKWKDPWFRSLKGYEKLVFLYVIDNCNNAGFYEMDKDMMAFQTGLEASHIEGALKPLARGLVGASGWVWVRRFLCHQKNERLNPENPAHRQIIELFKDQSERFSESKEFKEFVAPYKGLLSPIGKGKGKGTGGAGGKVKAGEGFAVFWEAYPLKVGKPKAIAAWEKHGCEGISGAVIDAVDAAASSQGWTKDGGEFIPHPTTWLNRRGWEDELLPDLNGHPLGSTPQERAFT